MTHRISRLVPQILPVVMPLVLILSLPIGARTPVEVRFESVDRFTDIGDAGPRSAGMDRDLRVLADHLRAGLAPHVPPGGQLHIVITDIDKAGRVEPARGGGLAPLRVIRDTTPPRIELRFRQMDAAGTLVREGARGLRALEFRDAATASVRDDPMRYERALLDEWIEKEFKR